MLDRKTLAVLVFLNPPCQISSSLPMGAVKTKGAATEQKFEKAYALGAGVVQAVLHAHGAGNAGDT